VASPVFKSRSGRDSNQDAPTTAENLSMWIGALLVAVGGIRRMFIHRTCTVAGPGRAWPPTCATSFSRAPTRAPRGSVQTWSRVDLLIRRCRHTLPSVLIRRNPSPLRHSAPSMEPHWDPLLQMRWLPSGYRRPHEEHRMLPPVRLRRWPR
jgi:hypothetical protein